MLKSKPVIIGLFAMLLIPLISASNAELWDLIILADVENNSVLPGQTPVITGIVVNHASKPVEFVQIHIRTGQESALAVTDEQGQFRVALSNFNEIPGTYIVNIVGSAPDGKTGITTTEFSVKGELTKITILEEKLDTNEAKKYLEANENEFTKDPIGFTLFNYYQKLQQEYLEEREIIDELEEEKKILDQQKAIANELRLQAIKEFNPTFGMFSGFKYEDYVDSLNPEIKETIINQLNFTKNLFEESQLIKDEILAEGGTEKQARQAYLEKIAITQESLNNFGVDITEPKELIDNSTKSEQVEVPKVEANKEITDEAESLEVNIEGVDITVDLEGKSIFVNVNGTIVEFFVNSTGIYQVDQERN